MTTYSETRIAKLLREQGHEVAFTPKPERKRNTSRISESHEQQALMQWWDFAHKTLRLPRNCLMAFPLQGARSARNGARMKREGCRKGTVDLFLAVPKQGFAGLWIEMKAPDQFHISNRAVSEEQWDFIHDMNSQGYATAVCYSSGEARNKINSYLGVAT